MECDVKPVRLAILGLGTVGGGALKLLQENAAEIKRLQSTIESNTKSITDIYKEAGFGDASDSTYTIDKTNGKLIIANSTMAQYVGTDGKIDT